MLALVTHSKLLPTVVRTAVTRVHDAGGPLRHVRSFSTLRDAVEAAPTAAFLILDFSALQETDELCEDLIRWTAHNATGQLVFVEAQHAGQWVGRALYDLAMLLKARTNHPLVSERDSLVSRTWEEIIFSHPFAAIMEDLRAEVEHAVQHALPGKLPNASLIWMLFTNAPKNLRVGDYCASDGSITEKALRNTIGAKLRRAKQAPPKDLITAFRVFIYLRLQELRRASEYTDWDAGTIVQHLDPENDRRKFRRSFCERTGLTLTQLQVIPSSYMLDCLVEMLSPREHQRPLKAHMDELQLRVEATQHVPTHTGILRVLKMA